MVFQPQSVNYLVKYLVNPFPCKLLVINYKHKTCIVGFCVVSKIAQSFVYFFVRVVIVRDVTTEQNIDL